MMLEWLKKITKADNENTLLLYSSLFYVGSIILWVISNLMTGQFEEDILLETFFGYLLFSLFTAGINRLWWKEKFSLILASHIFIFSLIIGFIAVLGIIASLFI